MGRQASTAQEPRPDRCVLIVAEAYQSHHRYVQLLTATPSLLGPRYLVVTATRDDIGRGRGEEHYDLAIVDLREGAGLCATRLRAEDTAAAMLVLGDSLMDADERSVIALAGGRLIERPLESERFRALVADLLGASARRLRG
jgi:hypothetical protein